MRASRLHFTFSACIVAAFSITLFLALAGFFRSVERNSSMGTGESRIVAQLKIFHEQLKLSDDPESVKRALKNFDISSGFGPESQVGKDLRKSYTPVIAIYANKPREAESRYLLGKKRELMELLVNNYRKEIPRGDIRIRAIYLNILFDAQQSLLNENVETEEVFLRRNKERLASLRSLVSPADAALASRVAALEGVFIAYEKGFNQSSEWQAKKVELLERAEKAIPKTAHELYAAQDSGTEDFRRSFLLSCVLSLIVACGSIVALLIAHKLARLQFETRSGALVAYLREFGRERSDPQSEQAAELLRGDSDWSAILQKTKAAEEEFVVEYQTHLALSKSLRLPYFVFTKDRVARLWNEEAAKLFGMEAGAMSPSVDDIIRHDLIGVREGDSAIMTDTIRGSFGVPQNDTFEFFIKNGDTPVPVELISSPIVSGRAAGGKVYCFREIRNEADRIDRAVHAQMLRVREFVQKVSNFYPAELTAGAEDSPAVREMTNDLNNMKGKIDEREILWQSETAALTDQVVRQREILQRLTGELAGIRQGSEQALDLVRNVHTADGDFFAEVCDLERDVQRWRANRAHLLAELAEYEKVIQTTGAYEQEMRRSAETMNTFLRKFENAQLTLQKFAEEARVRAVNLGFTEDAEQWEYADNARAYADSLEQFLARTAELVTKVSEFMRGHPGASLAPHLGGAKLDPNLLGALKEEQDRLAEFFQRWKESGAGMVEGGEQALGLLHAVDQKGAVATQLSETSILINDQAKGNLSRWN